MFHDSDQFDSDTEHISKKVLRSLSKVGTTMVGATETTIISFNYKIWGRLSLLPSLPLYPTLLLSDAKYKRFEKRGSEYFKFLRIKKMYNLKNIHQPFNKLSISVLSLQAVELLQFVFATRIHRFGNTLLDGSLGCPSKQ